MIKSLISKMGFANRPEGLFSNENHSYEKKNMNVTTTGHFGFVLTKTRARRPCLYTLCMIHKDQEAST